MLSLSDILDESDSSIPKFRSRTEAGIFLVGWTMILIGVTGMWFVVQLFLLAWLGFLLLLVRWWMNHANGRAGPWYQWPLGPWFERHPVRAYKQAWRLVVHDDDR